MVDRMQIALKLGLDILGIPVCPENYQLICDAVYKAKQRGVYLTDERVEFNPITKHAYSPRSHEDGGYPSRNLRDALWDIATMSEAESKWVNGWKIDEPSKKKLLELKLKLKL